MNSKKFSEAMGELDDRYIDEAVNYKKKAKKTVRIKWGVMAACLAVLVAVGGIFSYYDSGMTVKAYAHGTDEEITGAGAVINTGTISDTGEMQGHPLMFYLAGEDIETVRFSCKNQQINFTDWTEKRDEYGNAQNFTVTYGEDESEYYYLTIDWVPNAIIRELTDHTETAVVTLPAELREDIIVMEITFENGKTATKAITISLLDDGTFLAAFHDYKISQADTFVNRPDSEAIPRDILYGQDVIPGAAPTAGSIGSEPVPGGQTPDGTEASEHTPDTETEQIQPALYEPSDRPQASAAGPDNAVRAYYADTVFEVVSLELISETENEIIFSVCVSKGGAVQEPDRTITLQLNNGAWEVINEGY